MSGDLGTFKTISVLSGMWRAASTFTRPMFKLGTFVGKVADKLLKDGEAMLVIASNEGKAENQPKSIPVIMPPRVETALRQADLSGVQITLSKRLDQESVNDMSVLTSTLTAVFRDLAARRHNETLTLSSNISSSCRVVVHEYSITVDIHMVVETKELKRMVAVVIDITKKKVDHYTGIELTGDRD
ncbi:MAG: hypothetical protein NT099_07955 [Candidatus Saganbacteria bacterium]|nr:hypothetical protein [Candidatus Saganbacteria bacterium]